MSEPSRKQIITQLKDYIGNTFPHARRESVDVADKLFDQGIVDSLGLLEILGYIEMTYGLTVNDSDITAENFDSIASISAFVERSLEKV